tara:strand:+ start:97 stop:1863 length:1767 start_codon:yes stop_codon:yes gene_type:complete
MPENAPIRNAYIYVRWSSDEQRDGSTLDRQLRICRDHCAAKGYEIAAELIDEGLSAYSGQHLKKGKLGSFTENIQVGEIIGAETVLVTEELDRLSRQDLNTATTWFTSIFATGLRIEVVNSNDILDIDSLNNNLGNFIQLLAGNFTSNEESKKKSKRIREGNVDKREKLRLGVKLPASHKPPAWLKMVDGKYEPIQDRVEIINEIFDLALRGNGKDTIARMFNERMNAGDTRYDTWVISETVDREGEVKIVKAKKWTASKVGRILYEQKVIGYWQPWLRPRIGEHKPEGEPIKIYPVIVDVDMFNRVNETRTKNQLKQKGRGRNVANFLSGKCRCYDCGGPMVGRGSGRKKTLKDGTKTRYYSYYCENAHTGNGCDVKRGWSIPKLEQALMDNLLVRALDDQYFANPENEIMALQKSVNELKRLVSNKSEHFKNLLREGSKFEGLVEVEIVRDEIGTELTQLRNQLKQQEIKLAEKRGKVSQPEHIKRVNQVRDMIWSDDEEEEFQARMIIKSALQDIVDYAVFDSETDNIIVHIIGGVSQLIVLDAKKEMTGVIVDMKSMDNGNWKNHRQANIIKKYVDRANANSSV